MQTIPKNLNTPAFWLLAIAGYALASYSMPISLICIIGAGMLLKGEI